MLRAVLCLGLLLGGALPVQAWTRAQVRDVEVELALRPDGQLEAALNFRVEVQGGWLERLELPGLDEGLVLAPEQPVFTSEEDGTLPVPEVVVEDGAVVLRFGRTDAPRQGMYRAGIRYTARAVQTPEGLGRELFSWTLPGWEAGLERAAIVLRLPKGARPVTFADGPEEVHIEEQGEHTLVRFSRVHLPRATPWSIKVALPAFPTAPTAAPRAASGWPRRFRFGAFQWAAVFVLFVSWSGRRWARREAAREGMQASSPWKSARAASWIACVLTGLAIVLGPEALGWSLAALLGVGLVLIEDVAPARAAIPLGRFEPIPRAILEAHLREARRRRLWGPPWTDAGTLVGGMSALACAAFALWCAGAFGGAGEAWALGLACALVPWASSSRWRRPRGLATRVAALTEAASALRVSGCALQLVWYVPSDGSRPFEPRLRILTAAPGPGVLRLEAVAPTQPGHPKLAMLVVVAADSLAARALASAWGERAAERSHGGKRVAFSKEVQCLDEDLNALLRTLSAEAQRLVQASETSVPLLRTELATSR